MIGGYSPWFCEQLASRVMQRWVERSASLAMGAAQDFADYRYAVGYLQGLKDAIEIADDIRKEQEGA